MPQLTRDQLELLLEIIQTKGVMFTLDKCLVAGETEVALKKALEQSTPPIVPNPDTA